MKKNSYRKGIIGIALVAIGLMMLFAHTDVLAEEPGKEYSKELLINGGAEENADIQMIYGWKEPYEEKGGSAYYGIIYSEIAPPCWNTSLRAHSGERFFCTNLNTESFGVFRALGRDKENADGPIYVYQDVDITEFAGAKLILSGYVGSDSYLSMNLLDKDEKIVARCGEKWREKEHVESGEWAYREHSVRVPEGAVTARVYLNASYEYTPVGIPNPVMYDRTAGYFDDISLVAEQSEREPEGNELLYNCGGETGLLDEWHYDYEMIITDYSADFLEDETERGEAFSYDDLWTACKESENWCKEITPFEGDYFICTDLNRGPRGLNELIETPGPVSVWQDIDAADIPKGTELTLSGYVCKEGWLSLEIYDVDDNIIERVGEDYESFRTTSNDTWTQQEYTVTLPEEASSIRVFLNARYGTSRIQGGSLEQTAACFDDIHLTAEGWSRPEKQKPQPASEQDDENPEETPGKNVYKSEEKAGKYSGASMYLSSQWFLTRLNEDSFSDKVLDRIQIEDIKDTIAGNWFVYAQMDYNNEANGIWDPETEDYYYPMTIGYMHANVTEDGSGYSMQLDHGEIFDGDTGMIDAY
ncbi:MAG: hypothetical protein K6G58_08665, partial [Lachnospiraceae bacterium]|nr:hypothetical protein [Lachnospiraceae bacterium]